MMLVGLNGWKCLARVDWLASAVVVCSVDTGRDSIMAHHA